MNSNYYILFLLIILLLALFIVKEVKNKNKNLTIENNLYHLSLLFDKIYKDSDKSNNCSIQEEIINNNEKKLNSYLQNLIDLNYLNPEIIIMNKEDCLKFNGKSNSALFKNKTNSFCLDIWRQIKNEIGFLLEYRLIKTYLNKNTVFLYKRYNCKEEETQLIIGVSFTQK